ncbi:MAG: cell division ATP-binding protein FtsE [Candidatus Yanofskybacteria bacterium RIFCSPHIGHO2_01_FULL_44_17]|uniref:Cell division ATP-binding protein FtsE n=1 Tax=Candidatus Yanofskybacteria bacterium RIFCSPHIGHO2_01_FULL_44_17 TaxID=1802668 RepID=A0A1F8EW75_9BACT|nr:MAG: cell division ATP-binding protein FtsE [Candidatus Yanofskybacteria bacterium RIFCSPHIGHO2_01_FULL_44_17]
MIKLHKVKKIYEPHDIVLDNIDLEIKPGEFVCLVGVSGAGKSTLLKMLTKEERPTSGSISVEGIDLSEIKDNDIPYLRRKIGTVYQDFKLLSKKTAYENVAFAMEVSGAGQEEIEKDAPQILGIVGLKNKLDSFPDQMSGGEKQRLAIARAMIHRPKILLADEPTGNLDLVNSYDVVELLLKINELGTTVVLATHDTNIVNRIGRRVVSMDKGRIVRDQSHNGRYVI